MLFGRGRFQFQCPNRVVFVVAVGLFLIQPGSLRSEEADDQIDYSVALIGAQGVHVYAPDRWGILHVNLVNRRDRAVELLAVTSFKDEPTLQYGRRVRIPAHSRIKTWHPIRLPAVAPEGGQIFPIRTMVMDVTEEREVLLRSETGHLQLDGTLRVGDAGPVIGLMDNGKDDAESRTPFHLVTAARAHWRLPTRIAVLPNRVLAPGEESLNTLDQIVIADNGILDDGAGLAAVRHWVMAGGHLWIMLDRVDARLLELLFGDEIACGVVDRVGLTTVRITDGKEQWVGEYERPVDLVRVVTSDVDVPFIVDGWPASFSKNLGEGRVVVTTLGARGWMRARTPAELTQAQNEQAQRGESRGDATGANVQFAPLDPMVQISQAFFESRRAPLLPASVLEPLVEEYVGYSIPSRWLVLSLLIGFAGLLAGMGYWLLRVGRLEMMGLIGPGLALAVSGGLVLAGWLQRTAVSPAVADLQFAEIAPGMDEVRIEGLAGVYSPEPGVAKFEAHQGGVLVPDMAGLTGTTRRMVWTDLDVWSWENLPETAGLRSAASFETRQTTERIEANATFGPEGLIGHLATGEGRNPSDVIIATRDGRIGVELNADGNFVARASDVFAPDQFLSSGLLSDEQGRRRRVLQQLLANPRRSDFPASPQLFFWTDPWKAGFAFGEGRRSFGAALVAVPLRLQRPPSGTEVLLPAPFLPCMTTPGPDGTVVTGLYDHVKRQWSEKSLPSSTWLKFRIPDVLMPVDVQRARVTVLVAGPIGKLEIAGHREATPVPLKTWSDPVGTLTMETTETELFPVSAEGDVLLRVSGGDASQPKVITSIDKLIPWKIESLSLELQVKTIAPPDANAAPKTGR